MAGLLQKGGGGDPPGVLQLGSGDAGVAAHRLLIPVFASKVFRPLRFRCPSLLRKVAEPPVAFMAGSRRAIWLACTWAPGAGAYCTARLPVVL